MSNESFQRECTNYSQNAVLSYNRKNFSGGALTTIDDLATRLADNTFRAEILGEYGLITPESRTKYNLPATAENKQKGFGERLAESAKRHFNPLYNYNVNGVTREIQADLARSVADIHAGDDVEEVIGNAKYRETKSILINYSIMNGMAGVSGGVSAGGASAGGAFSTAQDYAALRDTTFESYDHVFTQRRQAFAQDLAIYAKAAVLGGLLATGAGALVAGGVLGAYASRAVAGTAIASLSGDGAGGKIASAVALLGISGLAYVTAAYAAKGGLEYAANHAKKKERQLDDVVNHTAGGATTANEERRDRWHDAHNAARWGSGIIAYLMPLIAFADAPDIDFSKLGKNGIGSVLTSNDKESPSIDKIEYATKTDLCKGDKAEFSFTSSDNTDVEKVVAELYNAHDATTIAQADALGMPRPSITPIDTVTVHQDGWKDFNIFGKDIVEGKGAFTINTPGDYQVLITATDAANNSTSNTVDHIYTIGNCESNPEEPGECPPDEPEGPRSPGALEDCVKERFSYGKDIKGVELREVYDYHTTPLKPEAGHEQGLTLDMKTWKGGSVSLNNVYDEHTPCDFNVDNTVVMLEHYTDAKALDYRVLVDVDAHGKFEIPKEFAAYKGDDIQVTWAEVTHCEEGKLGLEDLASYTHGKHVDIPKEAVFSGTVPAHVAPHYIDCDGTADVTPAPKHTETPKDDCGPCAKPCDKEYYIPVGIVETKAGPCSGSAPVMTGSATASGTLDTVVNTFGYMPSDVSGTPGTAVPGSLDGTINTFGYTSDAIVTGVTAPAGTLDATANPFSGVASGTTASTGSVPAGTLDATANPFSGVDAGTPAGSAPAGTLDTPARPFDVAPGTTTPAGAPSGTLGDPVDPFDVDPAPAPLTYNLGHYYQETYYIDDAVLRAFERQQQAILELRQIA